MMAGLPVRHSANHCAASVAGATLCAASDVLASGESTATRPSRRYLRVLSVSCLAVYLLAGCGGGEDDAGPTSNSTTIVNGAPSISGSPSTVVMQDTAYNFVPTASDPDGDDLVFSVSNLPPWATFSAATGMVSGMPGSADVGQYADVTISVTDGEATATLAAFDLEVVATTAGAAVLTWMPPTENTDGSPLDDLAGFKVYWGTTPGSYPNVATVPNPGISTYVIQDLTPATWYFVATAYDGFGNESPFSEPASKTIL